MLPKVLFISLSVAGTLLSTGCHSSDNPLLTAPKKSAITFLCKAQMAAEENTYVDDFVNSTYLDCVRDPTHFNPLGGKNKCDVFMKGIVRYAKKQSDKTFHALTIENLRDKRVAKRLGSGVEDCSG